MKMVMRPRSGGKTLTCIRESARTKAVIVCLNRTEVERIKALAASSGYEIPTPMDYSEMKCKCRGLLHEEYSRGIIFDNADIILQSLAQPFKVSMMTFNASEEVKDGYAQTSEGRSREG